MIICYTVFLKFIKISRSFPKESPGPSSPPRSHAAQQPPVVQRFRRREGTISRLAKSDPPPLPIKTMQRENNADMPPLPTKQGAHHTAQVNL